MRCLSIPLTFLFAVCVSVAKADGAHDRAERLGVNAIGISVINRDPKLGEKYLELLSDIGVGWVRTSANWSAIEASPGKYNWHYLDQIVDALHQRNLKILLTVGHTPCWARIDQSESCISGASKAKHAGSDLPQIRYWSRFVAMLSHRYDGYVAAIEIWNEPNYSASVSIAGGRTNSETLLSAYRDKLLDPAADAIHRASPNMLVAAPALGLSGINTPQKLTEVLRIVLQGEAAKKIDVVTLHIYPGGHDVFVYGRAARAAMQSMGIGNKPFWLSEFGTSADRWNAPGSFTAETLNKQKSFLTTTLQKNDSERLFDKLFWYAFGDNDLFGATWSEHKKLGLVDNDLNPRPVFTALRNYIHHN